QQDDLNKAGLETEADRLRERYKQIGDAQGHKFGEGLPGSKPPDFNLKLPSAGAPPAASKPAASGAPGVPPAAAGAPAQPGTAPAQRPSSVGVPARVVPHDPTGTAP